MLISHTVKKGLFGFRMQKGTESRILIHKPVKAGAYLVLIPFGFGQHSHSQHGLGKDNGIHNNRLLPAAQGIVGLRNRKLCYRTDIAGDEAAYWNLLLALHGKKITNLLHFIL